MHFIDFWFRYSVRLKTFSSSRNTIIQINWNIRARFTNIVTFTRNPAFIRSHCTASCPMIRQTSTNRSARGAPLISLRPLVCIWRVVFVVVVQTVASPDRETNTETPFLRRESYVNERRVRWSCTLEMFGWSSLPSVPRELGRFGSCQPLMRSSKTGAVHSVKFPAKLLS